jgi:hypothetical protein
MPSRESNDFLGAVSRLTRFSLKATRVVRSTGPNSARILALVDQVDMAARRLASARSKPGFNSLALRRSADGLMLAVVAMLASLANAPRGRPANFPKR